MRLSIVVLFLLLWALPTLAAETYTIPLSVVADSVYVEPPVGPLSTSVPFSAPFSFGSTCSSTGTLAAEIVDDGLEISLDVAAFGSGHCGFYSTVYLTFKLSVPELGGTVTMAQLHATPVIQNLPPLNQLEIELTSVQTMTFGTGAGSTSSLPGEFDTSFNPLTVKWLEGEVSYVTAAKLFPFIPGDTVTVPVRFRINANDSSPFQGTLKMRYEFKTTVPEPSAGVSISLGAVWLAGLSSMRK